MMQESYNAADEVIADLLRQGYDYSEYREQIAQVAFDDGLLNGNWDVTVDCDGEKSLRFIQEDEYDQHMDDDEDKPEYDAQVCYVATIPAYVWRV